MIQSIQETPISRKTCHNLSAELDLPVSMVRTSKAFHEEPFHEILAMCLPGTWESQESQVKKFWEHPELDKNLKPLSQRWAV